VMFEAGDSEITAIIDGPKRNPPAQIRLRFRPPGGRRVGSVRVNGEEWAGIDSGWVCLPGDIGSATVTAELDG
jgi:hypothetical protein